MLEQIIKFKKRLKDVEKISELNELIFQLNGDKRLINLVKMEILERRSYIDEKGNLAMKNK